MTPTPTHAELTAAAAHWRSLIQDEPNPHCREMYERAAQAIEIRRDTARTVCACCMKPMENKPWYRK